MASRPSRTARSSSFATFLLALSLATPALPGCSKENKVDVTQGNACTVDTDCADDGEACTIEKCKEGICSWDDAKDGTACPEGLCWSALCCTGCWDSTSKKCEKGLSDTAQCGVGGKECKACAAEGSCSTGATCEMGQCVQQKAANGATCLQDGNPVGACWDGACCMTCIRETCDGPGCELGCQSEMTPSTCGSFGRACQICTNLDGNPCTEPACVQGGCTELPVDGLQPECMKCQGGVCVVGQEGQPCGDTSPRCGQWLECIGEICVKCGQNGQPCCIDDNTPVECSGGSTCVKGQCCSVDETAMQTDPDNCGACQHKCSDQLKNVDGALCKSGECVFTDCKWGYFDLDSNPANGCEACSSPLTICGGTTCVDTTTDIDNCGGCGFKCTAPASCVTSNCECTAPMLFCSNACTDPRNDPWNCGGCGTACPETSMCAGSTCQAAAKVVVDSFEGMEADAGTTYPILSFAVDQTNIYFARFSGLYKRPLAGGALVKLVELAAPAQFEHVQVRGGRVYFAIGNTGAANVPVLSSVLLDGTSRVDYVFGPGLGIGNYVVDDSYVYWIPRTQTQGVDVRRRPIAGGMDAGPYATGAKDFGLCQDLVLYRDLGGSMHTRRIGEASPVDIDAKFASRLIVGATSDAIVFVNHDGAVYRVPVATRLPELVAPANVFPPNGTEFTHDNAGLIDSGKFIYPTKMTSGTQTTLALFAVEIASGAIAPRARFPQAMPDGTPPRFGSFAGKVYFWGGNPADRIFREP